MDSKIFKLVKSQWVKALIIVFAGGVLDAAYQPIQDLINHVPVTIDLKQIVLAGVLASLAYIKVTFLSNSDRQLLTPEKKE
jgi:hypothetical protein